jgi:hypothetical protein
MRRPPKEYVKSDIFSGFFPSPLQPSPSYEAITVDGPALLLAPYPPSGGGRLLVIAAGTIEITFIHPPLRRFP